MAWTLTIEDCLGETMELRGAGERSVRIGLAAVVWMRRKNVMMRAGISIIVYCNRDVCFLYVV